MRIRRATKDDCSHIAKLAMIAGEGIPAYFWEQDRESDQSIEEIGAIKAASETENFSYQNVHLALIDEEIAGMILAYRLPPVHNQDNLDDYPTFIRPLIELEQLVPDSFYINMIATYPEFRGQGVGTQLMSIADNLAREKYCSTMSIEVFEQNTGALNLYRYLGYSIVDERDIAPHPSHPYDSKILLLTKSIDD